MNAKKEMTTPLQCLELLKAQGYKCNFEINNLNMMICNETGESFQPDEIIIENTYRFEGDSNPADMSIIYSITARSGTRGTLMDAYGAYSDPVIDKFMKSVPLREENELQDKES